MLVNSCIVIWISLFKGKSSRAVAQSAVHWAGPCCHRGAVPRAELLLCPGPAVPGLWAGCCWQPSPALLPGAPLCLFSHPFSMAGVALAQSLLSLTCVTADFPYPAPHHLHQADPTDLPPENNFVGGQIWTFSSESFRFQHSVLTSLEDSWAGCNWHFTLGCVKQAVRAAIVPMFKQADSLSSRRNVEQVIASSKLLMKEQSQNVICVWFGEGGMKRRVPARQRDSKGFL